MAQPACAGAAGFWLVVVLVFSTAVLVLVIDGR